MQKSNTKITHTGEAPHGSYTPDSRTGPPGVVGRTSAGNIDLTKDCTSQKEFIQFFLHLT